MAGRSLKLDSGNYSKFLHPDHLALNQPVAAEFKFSDTLINGILLVCGCCVPALVQRFDGYIISIDGKI